MRWPPSSTTPTKPRSNCPTPAAPRPKKFRVLSQRGEPRTTRLLHRGDFLQPGDEVEPGAAAVVACAGRRDSARLRRSARPGSLARRSGQSAHAARDGQPDLAAPVRPGPGAHAGRLRRSRRAADASGTARLAGRASTRERGWSRKELIRLIVTSATYRQSSRHRPELETIDPRESAAGAAESLPRRGGDRPRLAPRRRRPVVQQDRRAERLPAAAGRVREDHFPQRAALENEPGRGPLSAAACTRSSNARVPYPDLDALRLSRRHARRRRSAASRIRRCRPWRRCNNETFIEAARALAQRVLARRAWRRSPADRARSSGSAWPARPATPK